MGDLRELSKLCPTCGGDNLVLKKVVLVFSEDVELREPSLADAAYDALATGDGLDADHTVVCCKKCRAEFPLRFLEQEYVSILDGIRVALNDLSEGRNRDCHRLCSFGGKDADLEAEGCTGIDAFIGEEGEYLLISVSGHKTISDSSCLELGDSWVCEDCKCEGCHHPDEVCPKCGSKNLEHTGYSKRMKESFDEQARELVCGTGYQAEGETGGWVVSFHATIKQPLLRKDDTQGSVDGLASLSEPDYLATAEEALKQAQHELKPYETEMASLSKALDELCEFINSECTEP